MRSALLLLAFASLTGGCAAWEAPRVGVEERWVPEAERPRVYRVRSVAPPAKVAAKAPARSQSYCAGHSGNLIHPLHFDGGTDPCPLLQWDIRLTRP
jgi:hypothetical protein